MAEESNKRNNEGSASYDGYDANGPSVPAMRQMTTESIPVPKEMIEAMYLNPATRVKGQLRKTFANPTPLPLLGFLMSSSTLGCTLMGWRGAGEDAAAIVGNFFFFGGMLQVIGAILEWILGNSFIFVVFGTYGAFWLTVGADMVPYFNAKGAYIEGKSGEALQAALHEYHATYAFLFLFMGLITLYFTICSIRTNVILVIIFFLITLAFLLLTGTYWVLAEGKSEEAARLQTTSGAIVFAFCVFTWYLELHLMLQSVDFPINVPVFDLSSKIPGATDLQRSPERQV